MITDKMQAARQSKAAKATERARTISERVEEVLADPQTNEELKRKLRYAHEVVTGQRSGSVGLMTDRRRELMREAKAPLD